MNEKEKFPGVSITISTYNQTKQIEEIVQKTLDQDYPKNKIEVIVIDDGSPDNTMEILKKFGKKIRVIQTYRKGRVQALNKAIKEAKFDFVCLSAGDIFFEKDFLKTIMSYFKSEKIAFVSPFSETGGNATVHRKKALIEAGLFDLNYNEPDPKSETETGWRDDTDLAFKEWDLGYKSIFTYAVAKFKHEHQAPANFKGKIKYVWGRIKNHRFDVLLYKKHPERAKEFLHISFGFWINPMRDFETATGLWRKRNPKMTQHFGLSSPTGAKLIEAKTPIHVLAIILGGIAYALTLKVYRLYASFKYGKFLI